MKSIRDYITIVQLLTEAAIHLNLNDVPSQLRGSYTGRKFKAIVTDKVTIPMDAGLWSDGSRDTFTIVRLADGRELPASDDFSAPTSGRQERTVTLEPGIAVVCHAIFNGVDSGLTFYVHPDDAAKMLPAPAEELTDIERKVLNIIGGIKSSYRKQEAENEGISDADYETARQSLFQKGLIDKKGAITVAGKNARSKKY